MYAEAADAVTKIAPGLDVALICDVCFVVDAIWTGAAVEHGTVIGDVACAVCSAVDVVVVVVVVVVAVVVVVVVVVVVLVADADANTSMFGSGLSARPLVWKMQFFESLDNQLLRYLLWRC